MYVGREEGKMNGADPNVFAQQGEHIGTRDKKGEGHVRTLDA